MQPSPEPPPAMQATNQPIMPPANQPIMPPWALAGLVPAVWLGAFLFTTGFEPMFRKVAPVFGVPLSYVWLALGAFAVAGVVGAGPGLVLGRRWPDAAGAVGAGLMVPGQLLSAFAPNFAVFLAGRVLVGFGAGAAAGAAAMVVPRLAPVVRWQLAVASLAVIVTTAPTGSTLSQAMLLFVSFRVVCLVLVLPALLAVAGIVVVGIARYARGRRPPAAGGGFTVPA